MKRKVLLAVLAFSSVLAANDDVTPQSPAAVEAIKKCNVAVSAADHRADVAKGIAKKQLVSDLHVALKQAMASGSLQEANAIQTLIDDTNKDVSGHVDPPDTTMTTLPGTRWRLGNTGLTISYSGNGTVMLSDWKKPCRWQRNAVREVIQEDPKIPSVTVTFASDMRHGVWVPCKGYIDTITRLDPQ